MSLRTKRRHVPPRFLESRENLPALKGAIREDKESKAAWSPLQQVSGSVLRTPQSDTATDLRNWKDIKGSKDTVKGKFSFAEDQLLRARLAKFFELKGFSWDEGLKSLIRCSGSNKGKRSKKNAAQKDVETSSPWTYIAACLPDRHIESIIQHVQCSFYEWPKKGRWNDVDSRRLVVLQRKYGNDWKYIGSVLDRYWRTCCDHFKMLEERGRVEYYYQLAIDAGDGDPDSFAPEVDEVFDSAGVTSLEAGGTQPIESGSPHVLLSGSKTLGKKLLPGGNEERLRRRMKFTTAEDKALLSIIADTCKVPYPLKFIPWTVVYHRFVRQFPNASVTSRSLLARYVMVLLPRSGRLSGHCEMIRRSIWRFLYSLIKQHADLHWSEIQWNTVLPHWGGLRCQTLARATISRCAGLAYAAAAPLFMCDKWKPYVKWLYRRTRCRTHEGEDAESLANYLNAIKECNGADPENPMLPMDLREEEMRNYTRRRMKQLRQEQVRLRDQAEHDAVIAEGVTEGMDYLERRMMKALDLVDLEVT